MVRHTALRPVATIILRYRYKVLGKVQKLLYPVYLVFELMINVGASRGAHSVVRLYAIYSLYLEGLLSQLTDVQPSTLTLSQLASIFKHGQELFCVCLKRDNTSNMQRRVRCRDLAACIGTRSTQNKKICKSQKPRLSGHHPLILSPAALICIFSVCYCFFSVVAALERFSSSPLPASVTEAEEEK